MSEPAWHGIIKSRGRWQLRLSASRKPDAGGSRLCRRPAAARRSVRRLSNDSRAAADPAGTAAVRFICRCWCANLFPAGRRRLQRPRGSSSGRNRGCDVCGRLPPNPNSVMLAQIQVPLDLARPLSEWLLVYAANLKLQD